MAIQKSSLLTASILLASVLFTTPVFADNTATPATVSTSVSVVNDDTADSATSTPTIDEPTPAAPIALPASVKSEEVTSTASGKTATPETLEACVPNTPVVLPEETITDYGPCYRNTH